jgi:hypothetical protein
MITEFVTFFGNYGHRYAEVIFVASCVTAPWLVDFFENDKLVKTLFLTTEEEAEALATQFAFEGEYDAT